MECSKPFTIIVGISGKRSIKPLLKKHKSFLIPHYQDLIISQALKFQVSITKEGPDHSPVFQLLDSSFSNFPFFSLNSQYSFAIFSPICTCSLYT